MNKEESLSADQSFKLAGLLASMESMTSEQRLEVFNSLKYCYCEHCGGDGGSGCQCWNDE